MASLVLTIQGTDVARLKQDGSCDHEAIRDIINHLQAIASGNESGTVYAQTSSSNSVAAAATVELDTVLADDTVTIGTVTLTAKASPSGENQWSQAGTNTVDGDSLASKINAHSVLSKIVSAVNVGGAVTVTALAKGSVGNHINISTNNGTRLALTVTDHLEGGTGGAETAASTYAFGQ